MAASASMQFDDFDVGRFLAEYWQKRPLLIRSAWKDWANPLDPDELAGLACEEGVESRLIVQRDGRLEIEDGPIAEARFGALGREKWTLLVQAVDHHVPSVAALLEPFRFIPNWRIDDVMVSYAADGGGVGAHFDQYDVFLIQGLGRRRWRIGQACDAETPLSPHEDLRLIASFEASEEWILEPGDILYVPPGIAHEGTAIGDNCMTYSIGFRAPSRSELIEHWSDHLLGAADEDDRYRDPDLRAQDNPGEISAAAIDGLHAMMKEKMLERDAFARWFGRFSSTPKYPDMDWRPEEPAGAGELRERLAAGAPLVRNPASRFSFIRQGGEMLLLFVDGHCFECAGAAAAFAERLCAQDRFISDPGLAKSEQAAALIAALIGQGSVAFEPED